MIKNNQQLSMAREKLADVERTLAQLTDADERAPYEDLAESIRNEVENYGAIREGAETEFDVHSLDGIGDALVKARLARGMTQQALAELVEVAPQQVQRWERDQYERTSIWRVAEIAEALDYNLSGVLHPRGRTAHEAYRTSSTSYSPGLFVLALQGREVSLSQVADQAGALLFDYEVREPRRPSERAGY